MLSIGLVSVASPSRPSKRDDKLSLAKRPLRDMASGCQSILVAHPTLAALNGTKKIQASKTCRSRMKMEEEREEFE